jgi:hypothetical protein
MPEHPRFIDHRGKLILYLDLAHASPGQHAAGIRAVEREILKSPLSSVLLLLDVTGAGVNHETDGIVEDFVLRTADRIRARAVVGASGLKRRTFDRAARPTEHALFDDLEAARDWLADR